MFDFVSDDPVIIPIIVIYEFFLLCFIGSSFVMGGLSVGSNCLDSSIMPTSTWFFVYGSTYFLISGASTPLIHLLIHMRTTIYLSWIHIVSLIATGVLLFFSWAWTGLGVKIYVDTVKCSFIHAPNLILSYSIVWLVILSVLFLIALGVIVFFHIMKGRFRRK